MDLHACSVIILHLLDVLIVLAHWLVVQLVPTVILLIILLMLMELANVMYGITNPQILVSHAQIFPLYV